MKYLIVESGIITNIIEADAEFAASIGAKEDYADAAIGQTYDPPTLAKLQAQLSESITATAELAETVCNLLYEQDLNTLGGAIT